MPGRTFLVVALAAFAIALATLQFDRMNVEPVHKAAMVDARSETRSPAPLPTGATAEIKRDADGHFRAEVLLNGQPVRMMVDSGASFIVIDEALAQRLGVAPLPTAYTGTAMTGNGEAQFAPIRLASVRVGHVERRDVPAGVMRGVELPTPMLGQSFLGTLSEVTISGDTMTLK